MKKNTLSKVWKSALVFMLSLSFLGVMTNSVSLSANEETLGIKENVKINEDKTQAEITFNMEELNENYIIESIQNPDGSTMDLINNPVYTVQKNGTYNFEVQYRDKETSETSKLQTETKSVVVDGIEQPTKTPEISPQSTITNGAVTIDIPAYDDVGWSNGEIKDLLITADFNNDNTTDGKKVVITLPEGMRYEQIKTAGDFDKTNVDASILSSYPNNAPLASAITKMELPTREATGPKSTYGDLVVYLTPGTKSATIELKVRVDGYKYYGPHTIKEAIEATAYMGSPEQEIGNVKQSINAIGEASGSGALSKTSYNTPTTQVIPSTDDETSYGLAYSARAGLYNSALTSVIGADRRYVKSAVIYMYYPEGTEFDSLVQEVNWSGTSPNVTNEPENHRVKITFTNPMSLYGAWVKYTVPKTATIGIHENPAQDYAEITNYDGTTYTTTVGNVTKYQVEVVDPSSIENRMQLATASSCSVDNVTVNGLKTYGPFFTLKNSTAGSKTNQVFEVSIDSAWQVDMIRIPFDSTVSGNELKNIQYQTSKEPSVWKTYTPANDADIATNSNLLKQISKDKVGLDEDEYFTALKAEVGKFSSTYSLMYATNSLRGDILSTYGSLKSGVTSATVTMSLYDINDSSIKTTATGKVNSSSVLGYNSSFVGSIKYYDEENTEITQLEAGNVVTLKGSMALNYVSSTSTVMKAPEIYIRQPEGMTIAIDTLKITDQDGEVVEGWEYTPHINGDGKTIYKIKTSDTTFIGFYFEDNKAKTLNFQYDISTNVKLTGNYDGRDLVAWGNNLLSPVNYGENVFFKDIYDFNGNNDTTDELFSFAPNTVKVVENKNMLVETFLSLAGEEPKDPFVDGNSSSISYFTPGTDADYTIKLTNNGDSDATGFETYIPIPKTGENYGKLFQSKDFQWDMKLKSAVTVPAGYEVSYSTDATGTNYASATYSTTLPANLEDVRMVKIEAVADIASGATEEIKVALVVDEDFNSATLGNKIGEMNVYNPVYDVVSPSYTGTLSGTKVGTELVIAEIGGTIFVDKDADGLYIPANGDTPVSGHEVKLYKWNDSLSVYEPALDSSNNQYTVTSDAAGVYSFDHTTGMGYGKYAVEFVEKTDTVYQYTINNSANGKENINSDAIIDKNIPNNGDTFRGWAIEIDPTKPVAKTIGCGFLKYNPPFDLGVSVDTTPNQVKVGDSIIVGSAITPDFWESIKATTGAYTWSLDDGTNITLTNNNDGTVTVSPTTLAAPLPDKSVNLTLTITDIYGNTKTSASVPIKILSNIAPTITVADTVAYVGDTVTNYSIGLTATDVTGNPMVLITAGGGLQNAWISESVPQTDGKYTTAGSYKITYKVKDIRGNETSVDRLVRVHEKPTITANSATYLVTDAAIDTQVDALASATWLEAPTTEGAAVSRDVTSAITKTVTSAMGVTDFSKVGLYSVTFNLSVPVGGTANKTVQVLVKDPKDESKDGLTIHAENFVLEYADAQDLTLAKSITNGSVQAYAQTEKNGEIEKIEKLNNNAISVDTTQLETIQSSTIDGGIYKLTFTATKDSKTVSKEIEVLVKPKNAVVDGTESLMLDAKAFVVDYEEKASLTEALAISNGSGQGYKVERNAEGEVTAITDVTSLITVEPTELTAIQSAPEEGGVYLLTYILSDNSITLTKQVEVFVKPKGGDIEKDISLYATNLSLTYEDALDLTSADVLMNTNAKATKINKDSYGNITSFTDISSLITVDEDQIEKINNAKVSGGVFTVTLSVTDGLETKTKDIQVFVWPGNSVTVDDTTISANGFTLTTEDAKELDLEISKKAANASAYALTLDGSNNVTSAKDITGDITVDESELKAIQKTGYNGGLYALTFTVTNGSTIATISVPVLVQKEEITSDLVIHANPFALENVEAKSLDKDIAVNEEHANVMAYQIERDIYGNISTIQDISANVDIDTTELAAINATDSLGGIYPLTFSITNNGNTEETTIDVLVKPEKYITDPTGVLTLSVTGFEITEADASGVNEHMALSKGNAASFKFELDEDGNILGFSDVSNNITVNKDELKTIKESGEGIYPLTYAITDGDITVSKTIYIVVTGKNTPSIVDGLAISGKDFTLTYDEALTLDQATAIEKAEIISVLVNNDAAKARLLLDSEITLEVKGLDVINATTQKGGDYPLTFIASYTNENGEIITNEVTVNVTVLEKGEVIISKPSIDGKDKTSDAKDVVATSDVTDINFLLSLCGLSFLLCLYIVRKRKEA